MEVLPVVPLVLLIFVVLSFFSRCQVNCAHLQYLLGLVAPCAREGHTLQTETLVHVLTLPSNHGEQADYDLSLSQSFPM